MFSNIYLVRISIYLEFFIHFAYHDLIIVLISLSMSLFRHLWFRVRYDRLHKFKTTLRNTSTYSQILFTLWMISASSASSRNSSRTDSSSYRTTIVVTIDNIIIRWRSLSNYQQHWHNVDVQTMKRYMQQEQEQKIEQVRLIKQQQQIEQKLLEEVRIAKIKAETFACKRCFAKYFSNIKFHEHIRDHHAKRSKFDVSSTSIASFSTSSHSIVFSFDTSNLVTTSKSQQTIITLSNTSSFTSSHSIISSSFTSKRVFSSISSKRSSLSNFASEFVSKRSKNAFFCSLTSFSTFAFMRSTFFIIKSIFVIFTKFYLTIIDFFNMFAEKFMKAKLFSSQNSFFSSDISVFRQARIIFYFLFIFASKSTKFEVFTAMHVSMKQSIRATSSRSSFRSSSFSFSTRFSFSTTFYFSSVCWHCQASFVIYLHNNECLRVAEKVKIFVKRRERRLFRKVWTNC